MRKSDPALQHPQCSHQSSRKINIWQASVILSPYLGPLLASFMVTHLSWRWPFWIYSIETGLCLVAVALLGEETYYNRHLSIEKQPQRQSRFFRLIGVEQWRSRHLRDGFAESMTRALRTIARPVVLLADFYYMCTFAWVVGINATLALFLTSLYGFGPRQTGRKSYPFQQSNLHHHLSSLRLLFLCPDCCGDTCRGYRSFSSRRPRSTLYPPSSRLSRA